MKKNLKTIIILGVLTVAMVSFAGCSKKETATITSSGSNTTSTTDTSTTDSSTSSSTTDSSTSTEKSFTLDELAKYDGKDGNSAYVAIDGKVYDVTNNEAWNEGEHQGNLAGTDLTDVISKAPHGTSVLGDLDQVGVLSK